MAFIRNSFVTTALFFCIVHTKAQTIYYPAHSSQLLKATAGDIAMLLQKAINASHFNTAEYSSPPASGIIFIYDSTIKNNGSCRVESNGADQIKFTAAEDNGLVFGVYQYLQQCGFRFYQPGSIWEIIPTLSSPYKNISNTFTPNYKYQGWFISGGHNRWAMDNNSAYGWDIYFGDNGHNWALYQRRNGMTGRYRFAGHRGDIMSANYLSTLQNNPCYIACHDGARIAGPQAVADINNTQAMQLWSAAINQQYTQFSNTIFGNKELYADYYRNFSYRYQNIGIEVPDGALWGNSKDNKGCTGNDYPSEADQHFTLANYTAQQINNSYPGKRMQLYAYSSHANIPSSNIAINNNIDVQVIPSAFQSETSTKGLLNRWYTTTKNISEYHYLNIPQWGGETPMFFLNDMKATLQRAKDKSSDGIVWEASPAKFASLPFLLAANNNLNDKVSVDSTLHNFCNEMFADAANSIYSLLQLWSDDRSVSVGEFIPDNKYKLPIYLQIINDAIGQTKNSAPIVKERIRELKAYLHHMVLYYDWLFDQRPHAQKTAKAAALCTYLAKINKLQLVNSYFLIVDICSRYAATDNFYQLYNVQNGTAYLGGNLPLITATEIDDNFQLDLATHGHLVNTYKLETSASTRSQFGNAGLRPLKKISVKISYTNGANYPNRSEFYIDAPAAGNISIAYTPHFNMPGKGYINFTVESTDKALNIIKDFSIDNSASPGIINVVIPAAGTYKLSIVSKYKSAVDLEISANGNYFYKNGPFLGNKTENYRSNLLSFPGYFYVPANLGKLFFSINNSNPAGAGFAKPDEVSKAFVIKDNNGNTMLPRLVTPADSAFFYIDIPAGSDNSFWQVYKMEQYNLCFANISNLQWFAERKPCSNANFSVAVINKGGSCITQLTAAANPRGWKWEVYDAGRWFSYQDQAIVSLPDYTSPNAIVSLSSGGNCIVTKRLSDDEKILRAREACANGAPLPTSNSTPVLYPNPSHGIYNCLLDNAVLSADEIIITDAHGVIVGDFKNVKQFDISHAAAGVYWYRLITKEKIYQGKLLKL